MKEAIAHLKSEGWSAKSIRAFRAEQARMREAFASQPTEPGKTYALDAGGILRPISKKTPWKLP